MRKFLFTLILLLFTSQAFATVYYVRKDGNDGNAGTANTSGGAWLTVDHAADTVSAGDIIRVQAGTYSETVTPGVNGTGVDTTVTFVADGAVTLGGFTLNGDDYLRIIGFTFTNSDAIYVASGQCTGIELWNNTKTSGGKFTRTEENMGSDPGYNGEHFKDSIFWGNTGSGLSMFYDMALDGGLVAYNTSTGGSDDVLKGGWINSAIYNNTDVSPSIGGTTHRDFHQAWSNSHGFKDNVFEANIGVGQPYSNEHVALFRNDVSATEFCAYTGNVCGDGMRVVWRNNIWKHYGNGGVATRAGAKTVSYMMNYHNTLSEMQESNASNYVGAAIYYDGTDLSYVFNNLYYEAWGNTPSQDVRVWDTAGHEEHDYNLAGDPDGTNVFHSSWTEQVHDQTNADPDFINYTQTGTDMRIDVNSDAIDNAGPLTTTTNAGTGTTLTVAVGEFFKGRYTNFSQYGGNLTAGDKITVGGDEVRISSITGDAITVTESFTWADGEPVYYGWAPGSLVYGVDDEPDIGALPYRPSGFALSATYVESGGTVTVTPNDDELVRLVVVYEDSIPIGADSDDTDGWTVSGAGIGTLDVRVYPFYPSTTLYTTASEGSDVTPPSVGNRIPDADDTGVLESTTVKADISDDGGVDSGTIVMGIKINDGSWGNVSPSISGTSASFTVTYTPPADFDYDDIVYVRLDADDLATNSMTQDTYSFTVRSEPDIIDPVCIITVPADDPHSNGLDTTADLSGTATDAGGIASVAWTCPTCTPTSGSASGTTDWTISDITIAEGNNLFTVTATDNSSNTGQDTVIFNLQGTGTVAVSRSGGTGGAINTGGD